MDKKQYSKFLRDVEERHNKKINFRQAWIDLKFEISNQIIDKEDGILFLDDLKSVMDDLIFDYLGE